MRWLMMLLRVWMEVMVESLNRYLYVGIACQHFCLFREAGSNFRHAHVHILRAGGHSANKNPGGHTGVGHDDDTPGMANPNDPKHNTVSRGSEAYFQPSPDGGRDGSLYPSHFNAFSDTTAYFYPAPEERRCAPGYTYVDCDCGGMCVTFNRAAFEEWQKR
jgi:hypothetical protein